MQVRRQPTRKLCLAVLELARGWPQPDRGIGRLHFMLESDRRLAGVDGYDPGHLSGVMASLSQQKFKRALILGTSDRMVHRIAKKLDLPAPSRLIRIEDVATTQEIERARRSRQKEGKHIIPVPAIEVKRSHGKIFFNSVRILFKRRFGLLKKHDVFEKSVVRPVYMDRGKVSISEEALTQMVLHCVDDYDPSLKVTKVIIHAHAGDYGIEVLLQVPFRTELSGLLHNLQLHILENIEKFAGIALREVNITIDSIA